MLFREYALKIIEIAQLSNKCKEELLNNVFDIFVFNDNTIIINDTINLAKLQKIVENVRKTLLDLYLNCERMHKEAIELFKVIKEYLAFSNNKNQISMLDNLIQEELTKK